MSAPMPPDREATRPGATFALYLAGFLGVIGAGVSVAGVDASNGFKFVLFSIAVMLAVLCFALGDWIAQHQ